VITYTCSTHPSPVHLSRHWPRFYPAICLSEYVCITTIEYKHHPRRTTDHDDWPPRYDSALVWFTWTPPCATFYICGHVWVESFHCFAHCERTMRCVHCKPTCVYITFRFTKTCICVTINITLCFPPTFPSIYLNSDTTTWLFLLTNPFQYPTINIRNHVWVHWFDWCEGLLDLLNVKRRPSKQYVWLTRSCPVQSFT